MEMRIPNPGLVGTIDHGQMDVVWIEETFPSVAVYRMEIEDTEVIVRIGITMSVTLRIGMLPRTMDQGITIVEDMVVVETKCIMMWNQLLHMVWDLGIVVDPIGVGTIGVEDEVEEDAVVEETIIMVLHTRIFSDVKIKCTINRMVFMIIKTIIRLDGNKDNPENTNSPIILATMHFRVSFLFNILNSNKF